MAVLRVPDVLRADIPDHDSPEAAAHCVAGLLGRHVLIVVAHPLVAGKGVRTHLAVRILWTPKIEITEAARSYP